MLHFLFYVYKNMDDRVKIISKNQFNLSFIFGNLIYLSFYVSDYIKLTMDPNNLNIKVKEK